MSRISHHITWINAQSSLTPAVWSSPFLRMTSSVSGLRVTDTTFISSLFPPCRISDTTCLCPTFTTFTPLTWKKQTKTTTKTEVCDFLWAAFSFEYTCLSSAVRAALWTTHYIVKQWRWKLSNCVNINLQVAQWETFSGENQNLFVHNVQERAHTHQALVVSNRPATAVLSMVLKCHFSPEWANFLTGGAAIGSALWQRNWSSSRWIVGFGKPPHRPKQYFMGYVKKTTKQKKEHFALSFENESKAKLQLNPSLWSSTVFCCLFKWLWKHGQNITVWWLNDC